MSINSRNEDLSPDEYSEWIDYAIEKCTMRGHELKAALIEERACLVCLDITMFVVSEEKKKYGGTFLYKKCLRCGTQMIPEYVRRRYNE